jgi:hypothetical protein
MRSVTRVPIGVLLGLGREGDERGVTVAETTGLRVCVTQGFQRVEREWSRLPTPSTGSGKAAHTLPKFVIEVIPAGIPASNQLAFCSASLCRKHLLMLAVANMLPADAAAGCRRYFTSHPSSVPQKCTAPCILIGCCSSRPHIGSQRPHRKTASREC